MTEKERLAELFQIAEDIRKEGGSIEDCVKFLLLKGVTIVDENDYAEWSDE